MGQIGGVLGVLAVQPAYIDARAALAPEFVLDSLHAAQTFDVCAVDGGDVIAPLEAGLLGRRLVIHFDDLGVAGLVDGQLHANAHQLAALGVEQVGVGRGGVVAGVLVAGTQQITGSQTVVQHGLVDVVVVVGAHIAVYLGHLVVHALLFLHAGDGVVKQPHRHQHRDGKSDRHCQNDDGHGHPYGNFAVHSVSSPSSDQKHQDDTAQYRQQECSCQNQTAHPKDTLAFLLVHFALWPPLTPRLQLQLCYLIGI